MAFGVDITKCYELGEMHVYYARKLDFEDSCEFYVALSAGKKVISFYSDLKLKKFLRVIDMSNLDEKIFIPGIDTKMVCCVLSKCLEAIDNNYFPENIGYYS